jgi:hypothetical protein
MIGVLNDTGRSAICLAAGGLGDLGLVVGAAPAWEHDRTGMVSELKT